MKPCKNNNNSGTLYFLFSIISFGGESLKGFSFALLVGIIFGTYSSIYVAGALVVDIEKYIYKKKVQS
ncbi:preprotein translocase chain secF [Hydrogenivirga sp. 128-5-R1-1]|uniref:preprotein translocase chain secF n=1 Tax=Hydrogenivirga sp. 128-5-R1-1 TaxID=392423 RepID=UPI00015F2788|nr:preprotein translocase chain secF [Hydrogenivirga sp. 128-5-R1-1]EDP73884.1 preprotein translocase chain secF [Hydrogenivirga sp. 128-5-R1-1]